jgi:hypothetical protein
MSQKPGVLYLKMMSRHKERVTLTVLWYHTQGKLFLH